MMERWSHVNKLEGEGRPSIGFIDTNLALDHALACSGSMDVRYFLSSGGAYPYVKDDASGRGFPITKVESVFDAYRADVFYFMDCYFGRDADELRRLGRDVGGASEYWTKIENDRRFGWRELQSMGIGVPDGVILKGLLEVLDFVRMNQDGEKVFYIKTSKHRGSKETGNGVMTWQEALVSITSGNFGPFLEDMEFLIQFKCPGKELGVDVFVNGIEIIRPYLLTIEVKGAGTVGKWVEESILDDLLLNKALPSLIETDYRGNISFEFFIDGKGRIQVHDPCARPGYPCSAIQAHRIVNLPEVYTKVARRMPVRVDPGPDLYVAQIGLYTDDRDSWRIIRFPEEFRSEGRSDVGFRRAMIDVHGDYWYVPGDYLVATALGSAGTVEDAIDRADEVADQIECSNSDRPGGFRKYVTETLQEFNSWNIGLEF